MPSILEALVPPDSAAATSQEYLDVGLGARPHTTLEWAASLRRNDPGARVLGLDRDPDVVAAAGPAAVPGLRFAVANWTWPGLGARAARALNVLRDYTADEAPLAHLRMAEALADGGVLVEGSCGPHGEVGAVHVLRRDGLQLVDEGLLFWTDGSQGSAPILFRDRLPVAVRRAVQLDHPLGRLMEAWMAAHAAVRGRGVGALAALAASVDHLGDPELTCRGEGAVWWRRPCGLRHRGFIGAG
ncbi:MAG: hypothetical protein AAF211_00780 [Myxococcota bacterium]